MKQKQKAYHRTLMLELRSLVETVWVHDDYEYSLTVKAEFKDTILLWLLKEHFKTVSELRTFCEDKDIPFNFSTWP